LREIEVRSGALEGLDVDLVAVPARRELSDLLRELDGWLGGTIARLMEQGIFLGESDETSFFPGPPGRPHILLLGTGDTRLSDPSAIRGLAGRAVRLCRAKHLSSLALLLEDASSMPPVFQAAAEGLLLGDYSFDALKRSDAGEAEGPATAVIWTAQPVVGASEAAAVGFTVAHAQNFARSLVAQPGNVAKPSRLAEEAEELSGGGLLFQAWDEEKLRREGFGALLAVSKGSREPPRFIILEHPGEGGPPLVLVGKGITFDSGGISLKPAKGMEEMKYDMAGGAAVLGAVRALSKVGVPRRVVALVPAAENLPSGSAVKPGDVIRGLSGRSIEVVNTDAEGRLILSDALAYANRLSPAAVVDIATLTGGCVVALGKHASGLMGNDDALAGKLIAAGERSGERAWRLPLWPEYRRQIDSEIADIKNSGGREASPITAGVFLQEFVDEVPWAHLDIAGTAWAEKESGWQPKGATGFGVRLLVEWVRGLG
jgi:leucyl aminopeptidase